MYIFLRESFIQSFFADTVSFGFLIFSIWFSRGDNLWTAFCMILFVLLIVGKARAKRVTFYNKNKLKKYIEKEVE